MGDLPSDFNGLTPPRDAVYYDQQPITLRSDGTLINEGTMTNNDELERRERESRDAFEKWFQGAMHLGGKCFVDKPTKRRMWRAWQAALSSKQEKA